VGRDVGVHQRCWSSHQTITDPAHVRTAAGLRAAFGARTTAMRGPTVDSASDVSAVAGARALTDYEHLFDLSTTVTATAGVATRAPLEVAR
jgi:hypothetical protein